MRSFLQLLVTALVAGACASTPKPGATATVPAAVKVAGPSAADYLRAQQLADLIVPGGNGVTLQLATGSRQPVYPPELGQRLEEAAVIIAFIVDAKGKVDSNSRTIIYLEGYPEFAATSCAFLTEARFVSPDGRVPRTFTYMPFVYHIRNLEPDEKANARLRSAMTAIHQRLSTMTPDERVEWLAARPACAALKD